MFRDTKSLYFTFFDWNIWIGKRKINLHIFFYLFLFHLYWYISVKQDDPDKPVISALGFLGRLPGGKWLLLWEREKKNIKNKNTIKNHVTYWNSFFLHLSVSIMLFSLFSSQILKNRKRDNNLFWYLFWELFYGKNVLYLSKYTYSTYFKFKHLLTFNFLYCTFYSSFLKSPKLETMSYSKFNSLYFVQV